MGFFAAIDRAGPVVKVLLPIVTKRGLDILVDRLNQRQTRHTEHYEEVHTETELIELEERKADFTAIGQSVLGVALGFVLGMVILNKE